MGDWGGIGEDKKPDRRKPSKNPLVKSSSFTEEEFQDYAAALGRMTLAWNSLHEALGAVFWTITGDDEGRLSMAVWGSLVQDRARWKLLKDAIPETIGKEEGREEEAKRLRWVIRKTQKHLADHRNAAIHAPVHAPIMFNDVVPATNLWNPLAERVRQSKNPVEYFDWIRECSILLRNHTRAIERRLRPGSEEPLPQRPVLPPCPVDPPGRAANTRTKG